MRISLGAALAVVGTVFVSTSVTAYECPKHQPKLTPYCCVSNDKSTCFKLPDTVETLPDFNKFCRASGATALCCAVSNETSRFDCDFPDNIEEGDRE
ncbi:hypothetical protein VE00_03085 [Pseudogymnoascus sp. WSF 3629]|nr:hypothetical protein VE00_03085 [Pseudogymnoascus sp. WSF 3629]